MENYSNGHDNQSNKKEATRWLQLYSSGVIQLNTSKFNGRTNISSFSRITIITKGQSNHRASQVGSPHLTSEQLSCSPAAEDQAVSRVPTINKGWRWSWECSRHKYRASTDCKWFNRNYHISSLTAGVSKQLFLKSLNFGQFIKRALSPTQLYPYWHKPSQIRP